MRIPAASEKIFLRAFETLAVVSLLFFAAVPSLFAQRDQTSAENQLVVTRIEIIGNRRIQRDTLLARIFSRPGDVYSDEAVRRDFQALWNTQFFEDIRLEVENDPNNPNGRIVVFYVTERPIIRRIEYKGNKSVTESDILDAFKDKKVGLSVESQFDPTKITRAEVVLKSLLAAHGHQFATVKPTYERIAATNAVKLVFNIDEGPTVKVGTITITGNKAFSDRRIIRTMRNDRPYSIPLYITSIPVMNKTFDRPKLDEDLEVGVRGLYQDHGYFKVDVNVTDLKAVDQKRAGLPLPIPVIGHKKGKATDITIHIDEGNQYHMGKLSFQSSDPDQGLVFKPEYLARVFPLKEGDLFSSTKVRKALENYKALYGQYGYIDFVAEPMTEADDVKKVVNFTMVFDQEKQYFVRRIEFSGNTTTRDKVIRREILLDEGQVYNNRLWELSILRLNQLGYFDSIKPENAELKRNVKAGTVDINLKVKEKGKQSISFSGGVSGIAGSFVGLSYQTNNFLGLGETLTFSVQFGNIQRNIQFGFTEPYLFDKPIQTGFTLYTQRFNYNQAREASILSGQNLIGEYNQLGSQNLLNYISNGYGGTVFMQYPLRRSFARLGLTYGYDISNVTTLTSAATSYFTYLDFQGIGGPNQLSGIRTSKITPSYTYNTVNSPIAPTAGKSIFFSAGVAGAGGNVNTIEPTFDIKYFRHGFKKGNVIGVHVLGRMITGYGGKVAPPFSRYYIGGENDIRGFDIWGISPIGFIPSTANVNVLNNDGTARQQRTVDPITGAVTFQNVTQTIPIYQLVFPGGDTNVTTNLEYRIPIFGPVTLAAFFDAGIDKLSWASQLRLNPGRITQLNAQFPEANFTGNAVIAPGTQKIRASTGLELQVLMPVVNAPFRVYFAYNPLTVRENLQPPIAADRSLFPNDATFRYAIGQYGAPVPFFEKQTLFRFTIGRTF